MPGMGTGQLPPQFVLQHGRYVILSRVGMGGMGAVYRAADTRLGNKAVAIKEMSDAGIADPGQKQQAIDGFRQEAQMLAHLDHSNLPKVTDYFTENGKHYIVMEFVEGETLESYLQRQAVSESTVRVLAAQLFDVLGYLHRQNPAVIFRDLKPANIMLTPQGRVKLIDFGIARIFKTGKPGDTMVMGTPGYAAPEQHGNAQTDARSDIYSLGVVLHHALTGYDPSLTPFVLPPVRQLNPSVSPQMEQAIAKAIQTDRSQRFQSMSEFG
ncbi:MAG: serine/threonine protein kinase, partial [Anaerolineae bacterium]|nr:serine/threonine protein kinase [Anaerolineae bacterium]